MEQEKCVKCGCSCRGRQAREACGWCGCRCFNNASISNLGEAAAEDGKSLPTSLESVSSPVRASAVTTLLRRCYRPLARTAAARRLPSSFPKFLSLVAIYTGLRAGLAPQRVARLVTVVADPFSGGTNCHGSHRIRAATCCVTSFARRLVRCFLGTRSHSWLVFSILRCCA